MFDMFQYRFAVVAVITFSLVFNRTDSHVTHFHKRGNVDVFNLLLGLYKLNPLKASKVYKTFSDNLLNGEKVTTTLNFDSSENKGNVNKERPTIKQLKEIGKLIHPKYKRPIHNYLAKPEYDIEDVNIEKFNVNVVVNEKLANKYKEKEIHSDMSQYDNFSGLLNHLGTDFSDMADDMPSTKLVPVHDSAITKASTNTQLYAVKRLRGKINIDEFFNDIPGNTVVRVNNDIQDRPTMNDNIETADVIIL